MRQHGRRGDRKPCVLSARISAEADALVTAVASEYSTTRSGATEMLLLRHKPMQGRELDVAAVATALRPDLVEVQERFGDATVQVQRIGNNLRPLAVASQAAGAVPQLDELERIRTALEAVEESMALVVEWAQARSESA